MDGHGTDQRGTDGHGTDQHSTDQRGTGAGPAEVGEVLKEAIATICDVPLDDVADGSLLEDLGVDSLAVAEIVVEVEIRLDCELPVHLLRDLIGVRTVGEVVDQLGTALGAGRAPAP